MQDVTSKRFLLIADSKDTKKAITILNELYLKATSKSQRIECFLKAVPYIENISDKAVYIISERLSISHSRLSRLIKKKLKNDKNQPKKRDKG